MHLEPRESMIYGKRQTDPESSAKNEHEARTSDSSVPVPLNRPPGLYDTPSTQKRHEILSRAVIKVLNSNIAKITYGEILSGLFLNETRNSMRGQMFQYTPYSGYGYTSAGEDAKRRLIYLYTYCNRNTFHPGMVATFLKPEVSAAQAPKD